MERNELIKFGIFHESSHNHDSTDITSACVVDNNSYIVTTLSKVIKMNGSSILDTAPMQFSHSVYVEAYQLIIAISIHSSNLFVFPSNEIGRPLIANFPTTQHLVSFLIYSPKSESIITIGEKIKIWSLNVIKFSKMVRPSVTISHIHTFKGNFNISSYHSIGFDTDKEILYLPTSEGILPYTIQGEALSAIAKVSSTMSTLFCYSNGPKELLLSDRSTGLSIWSNIGTFVKRIPFGGSSIAFMTFIDDENVIIVDDENVFYLLNTKSNRSMLCLTMNRTPLKVLFIKTLKPSLLVQFEDHYEIYSISIQWQVWALNVIRPVLTKIEAKKSSLPRFLVQTENSFVKLYSPKDGKPLTAATPSCAAFPVSILYDRGYFIHHVKGQFGSFLPQIILTDSNREILIMNLDNEQTVIFDALTAPMKEVSVHNFKTNHILPCFYDNRWCYAIHADIGEFSIIDYNRFQTIEKFKLTNTKIANIFYHHPSSSMIVMYDAELIRFSLIEKVILGRVPIDIQSTFSELFCDSIFIGDKSGKIHKFNIDDEDIISKDVNEINGHLTAISHISFSPSFMISSSFDGAVVIWDYSFNKVSQITAPLPIFSCCFLNGHRDIILGTETELMIMKGEVIFKGDKDDEFEDVDNFLKNADVFMNEPVETINLSGLKKEMKNSSPPRSSREKSKGRSLYRERIEKLKQKVEEMNKEREKKMREDEELEKQGKKEIDATMKKRIIDQMITLTLQATEENNVSEMANTTKSIQFQPQKPQVENTNNPRNNQNQNNQSEGGSRSSSRSRKSISASSSEVDEEAIKLKGKNFLKKSIIKDEKFRVRKEKRQRRLKEKKEKEQKQKELLEKVNSMRKIERQKTEQEILLDSMDTTLTIGEIPSEEPEPEIFFRQPTYDPPQISRPIRKATAARRYTPAEFKAKFEQKKEIEKKEKKEEEDFEDEEKHRKSLKMKKKKKNLKKRLKRAPTPPEIRKNSEETKEPAKKKRAKTPPMLEAPPKVIEFKTVTAVVDSNVVQEVFIPPKKDHPVKLPDKPVDNRAPIRNSNFVDIEIDAHQIESIEKPSIEKVEIEQTIEKVPLEEEEVTENNDAVSLVKIQPLQPPPPPPSSPSSIQKEAENEQVHFEVKPPSEPFSHKIEPLNIKNKPEAPNELDGQFYLTQVGDQSKLRKMLDNWLEESAAIKKRRKVTIREIERTLQETQKKIEELEEENQIDPLAWRGVPPKLEKMKVKNIEFFDDDQNDYNQSVFLKFKNKSSNVIRNKRDTSRSSNRSSCSSDSRNSNSNYNRRSNQNEDPSALGFLSNWSARKAQRSTRMPSSTRRSKVSRVEKNKPWM